MKKTSLASDDGSSDEICRYFPNFQQTHSCPKSTSLQLFTADSWPLVWGTRWFWTVSFTLNLNSIFFPPLFSWIQNESFLYPNILGSSHFICEPGAGNLSLKAAEGIFKHANYASHWWALPGLPYTRLWKYFSYQVLPGITEMRFGGEKNLGKKKSWNQ